MNIIFLTCLFVSLVACADTASNSNALTPRSQTKKEKEVAKGNAEESSDDEKAAVVEEKKEKSEKKEEKKEDKKDEDKKDDKKKKNGADVIAPSVLLTMMGLAMA